MGIVVNSDGCGTIKGKTAKAPSQAAHTPWGREDIYCNGAWNGDDKPFPWMG